MKFLTDSLCVRYDSELKSIVIEHSDHTLFPRPLVQIREETYSQMSFSKLADFVGSRVLLLMPTMRVHFNKDIERMTNQE